MKELQHIHDPAPTPVETHLESALDATDDEQTKFHLREAYQKCIADSEHVLSESP
jgi:hypothetical protein